MDYLWRPRVGTPLRGPLWKKDLIRASELNDPTEIPTPIARHVWQIPLSHYVPVVSPIAIQRQRPNKRGIADKACL